MKTLWGTGPWVVSAVTACSLASLSLPASAQDVSGEALARYALDFCAAIVDGQPMEAAHAAASAGAELRGPQPAGDDVDLIGEFLQADRETAIFVLGPPNAEDRVLMAFVRADASRCAALARRGDDALTTLYARLAEDASVWKEQAAVPGAREFSRPAAGGAADIFMTVLRDRERRASAIVVDRNDASIASLTAEQRTAWATTVVSQCAMSVHRNMPLTADAFAPFFEPAASQRDGLTLDETPGNPQGTLVLNARAEIACVLAVGPGGLAVFEQALVDALLAVEATAQKDGTYRARRPKGAPGRDALFEFDRPSPRALLMSVKPR